MNLNLSDRDILAKTLEAEAGGEGGQGMLGVGAVIMNRIRNGGYGSGMQGVILKDGAFSPWNSVTGYANGAQGKDMMKLQPSPLAYTVADQLLSGGYQDPTGGALNFYNPEFSNPWWGQAQNGGEWLRIGKHLFGTAQERKNVSTNPTQTLPPPLEMNPAKPKPQGLIDIIGNAVGGKLENLKGALNGTDQDASDRLSVALMSLSGNPQQLAPLMQMAVNDIQQRKTLATQNKSIEYLKSIDPSLAAMAEANPSMVGNILSAVASKQLNPKNASRVVGADVIRKLFPGQEVEEGLYEIEELDGAVVGAKKVGGGGNSITIDNSQDENNDVLRDEMKEYLQIGRNSRQTISQAELLGGLLEQTGTGFGAGLKQFAFDTFGVDVRDDAAAAAAAIIAKLVPAQREPGSGPMSDADLGLYKLSLPGIAATPGGNKIIINSMIGIAKYNKAVGDLARDQLTGKISYDEFYEKMAALPDPLAEAKAFIKTNNIGPSSTDGGPVELTKEQIEAYKTLNIPIPGVN